MKSWLLSVFIFILYQSFRLSWRTRFVEPEKFKELLDGRQPFILSHWHGDELALVQTAGRYRAATIVSTSKDGNLMNNIFRWLGGTTVRGSSTRGGVGALKGLFAKVKQGHNCSFAVDGPKGPIHVVKPGVFEVSRLTQIPIFACGIACDRAWHFPKSWNKTYLPKPFAKILIIWTGPYGPVAKTEDPKDESLAKELALRLHGANQQAASIFAESNF